MDLHDLLRPDGPWLRVFVGDAAAAADAARALARGCVEGVPGVAVRHLRGRKMRRAAGVFDEFAAALQFPPYFGENWDALDECLADLEWLPADAYVLLLLDAAHLLDQDGPDARRVFWETLARRPGMGRAGQRSGVAAREAVPRAAPVYGRPRVRLGPVPVSVVVLLGVGGLLILVAAGWLQVGLFRLRWQVGTESLRGYAARCWRGSRRPFLLLLVGAAYAMSGAALVPLLIAPGYKL